MGDIEEDAESSSDEDSIPPEPEFEMTVPWFRRVKGFAGRRPYTKATCVVKVRLSDTLKTFGRKVREQTELSQFKLVVAGSGELLLECGANDKDDDDDEDDSDEEGGDGSASGGGSAANDGAAAAVDEGSKAEVDVDDEARDMAILLAVGEEKEKLIAEKEAAKQPKSRPIPVGVSRVGDNRSLQDIGVKMPHPKKNRDGKDSSSRTGTSSKEEDEEHRNKPDASFLPRPGEAKENSLLSSSVSDESLEIGDETATGATSTRGEGKNNDDQEDVTSATSREGTGTANNFPSTIEGSVFSDEEEEDPEAREAREASEAQALLEAAANDPGVTIEIEEEDEVLDQGVFAPPEPSAVLLARAANAVNKRWWERAADGNISMVQEIWKKEDRQDLLAINWRNPEAHERTAVMAASLCGQLHTIKWLVKENNARVNGQDAHGCTALNLACRGGYPKVAKFLLESKAKANTRDKNGWSAAVWALAMGHLGVLQVLANFGVPLQDLGSPAPFNSSVMSATSLMPLPCVKYKAAQDHARQAAQAADLAARARAHEARMEALRLEQEAKLMGAEAKAKVEKIDLYKHRFMRDARENWSRYQDERAEAALPDGDAVVDYDWQEEEEEGRG